MKVIFNRGSHDIVMICFYSDQTKQKAMMHKQDIDKQVKLWQETNTGNPPVFSSRITIKEFTNRLVRTRINDKSVEI